jgi:hypothetical protein
MDRTVKLSFAQEEFTSGKALSATEAAEIKYAVKVRFTPSWLKASLLTWR